MILTVLAFTHLVLAILYCFFAPMPGAYEVITVSILFCSIASVNYCCLTFYMIYVAMNIFNTVCVLGLGI